MMHAYDIDVGPWRTGNPDRGEDGWCYGLPPGIAPEQWPLDPVTGHPLVHGFTLLLPEDYRVHGPEIVAVSFFATPVDGNDGGASVWNDAVAALIDAPGDTAPDDPALLIWWQRARQAHPRLHRMRDILDYAYAAVLLTRSEYEGSPCPPPELVTDPLHDAAAPAWLSEGAAPAFERFSGRTPFRDPAEPLSIHCPLRLIARADDPNAGLAPQETWGNEDAANGYRSPYYTTPDGEWHEQPWVKDHAPNHLGGRCARSRASPNSVPIISSLKKGSADIISAAETRSSISAR